MISLNVNQKNYTIDADPEMPLLWKLCRHFLKETCLQLRFIMRN